MGKQKHLDNLMQSSTKHLKSAFIHNTTLLKLKLLLLRQCQGAIGYGNVYNLCLCI